MDDDKFIIFPKLNSNIIYLGIFILFSLLRNLIPTIIEETLESAKIENKNISINSYFDLLSNFIGDISVGIWKIINLFKCEETSNKNETTEGQKIKEQMKKNFKIFLPLIALIDIIAQFCLFFLSILDSDNNNRLIKSSEDLYFVVFIDIISRYYFSRFILKDFFYRHHIFSIILTSIGFLPLIVLNLLDIFVINSDEKRKVNYPKIIFYLIIYITRTILYSLEDVINKICLKKLLLRPYELMFYKAVFQIPVVLSLSVYMIISFNIKEYISNLNIFGRILYRSSFIISNIFRTLSLITIIEKISPNHLSVLKSTEFDVLFIFFSIYNTLKKTEDTDNNNIFIYILGSICCLVSLFASAIHNEMIIIKKWGLYECTNYYKSEIKIFSNIDTNLEKDEEKINDTQDSLLDGSISQDFD